MRQWQSVDDLACGVENIKGLAVEAGAADHLKDPAASAAEIGHSGRIETAGAAQLRGPAPAAAGIEGVKARVFVAEQDLVHAVAVEIGYYRGAIGLQHGGCLPELDAGEGVQCGEAGLCTHKRVGQV